MLRAWNPSRSAPSRSSWPPVRAGAWARSTNPKAFLPIGGRPMLTVAATAAAASESVRSLVVVAPAGWEEYAQGCVEFCGRPAVVVTGGDSRQASVRAALAVIEDAPVVAVHDAARPFAAPDLFTAVIDAIDDATIGVIPVVPVTDTVKRVLDGVVVGTVDREELALAQTPQAFATEAAPRRSRSCCGGRAHAHRRRRGAGVGRSSGPGRARRPDEHEDHHPLRSRTGRSPDGRRGWLRRPAWGSGSTSIRGRRGDR